MVLKRLLVFTAFFLTSTLSVSAEENSSLYIDTLNEVDKILGDHHFFKNTAFENSDVIEKLISNIDQQNLIFLQEYHLHYPRFYLLLRVKVFLKFLLHFYLDPV